MRAPDLVLRCYAEKQEHDWVAVCLDLNLAAQGESFREVRHKLSDMICEYVNDAVVGQDKEFAPQLLKRRAPLYFWLKYYRIYFQSGMVKVGNNFRKLFSETLPLTPSCPNH